MLSRFGQGAVIAFMNFFGAVQIVHWWNIQVAAAPVALPRSLGGESMDANPNGGVFKLQQPRSRYRGP